MATVKRNSCLCDKHILIMQRFIRDKVITRQLRTDVKNLRLLNRAFDNYTSPLLSYQTAHHKEQYVTLDQRKYRTDYQRDVNLQHNWLLVSSESANTESEPVADAANASSSSDDEQVTVETVVHNLYLRLEATTQECNAKDHRIQELETLVASLTAEKQCLVLQLGVLSEKSRILVHDCANSVLEYDVGNQSTGIE